MIRNLRQPGPEPKPVASRLVKQGIAICAVSVPRDRRRVVDELSARPENSEKQVEVLTTARRSSRAEQFIEPTETEGDVTLDGEVGTSAVASDCKRKQWNVRWRKRPIIEARRCGIGPAN